ncbi:hypothetical protein OsI_35873 [Oryza sativa Indica Group]|uniref:Uncharacterized protein n=1 Tax=Oryza sativa subsp. indica TaxID=39946 RepID=A2ZDK7_ORYSI|nr:hypothetical protein OsI_35873 [Oryza sativa Indica Group]
MPIKKPQDFVREFCNKVDLVRMGTRLKVHKPPPVTDGLVSKLILHYGLASTHEEDVAQAVRVCVEYMYKVGYSLEVGVVV